MKILHMVAFILLFIGGLNWGLIGLLKYNLVDSILGVGSSLSMIVYILVGLSAVYIGITHKADCKICGGKGK